ncbi:Hypothetical protein Minf_0027 [Methylacidiphilum infernorum V4]|uniref:Uncharacterized protein n=1 Tax=Methylacidiphilum infernorum (isolate V4) TaxID=481448 RepID=B3DWJ2_METI4|nr:Hypothetical protein Minf_0027 [Methylacidiphilum infernorum V4]
MAGDDVAAMVLRPWARASLSTSYPLTPKAYIGQVCTEEHKGASSFSTALPLSHG